MKILKRAMLILFLILLSVHLFSKPVSELTQNGETINLKLSQSSQLSREIENNFIQKTFAILAEEVEIVVNSMRISNYDLNNQLISTTNQIDNSRILLAKKFIMRDLHGFTIKIEMKKNDNSNGYSILEAVDFDINPISIISFPETVSEAFLPVYESFVDNYETCYLRNLPTKKPSILIINHQLLNNYSGPFIPWKKSLGFDVTLANIEEVSPTKDRTEIKNYIADVYHNSPNPPDYLIIVGDVSGAFSFPTFTITSALGEENATDLNYTLIDGDDFLPEILTGRISVSNSSDYTTIISKIYNYEKNPYMTNTDWMKSALVVAGNYSSQPPTPVTPLLTSKWIHDELIAKGYTRVDTFFYPNAPETCGPEIVNSINEGVQFVSYRGWGNVHGWNYPQFYKDVHLPQTTNAAMMPIVTSIVCNTGDFANQSDSECFGEKWMRLGTPTSLGGCVAFYGPTDLHTSTEMNNSIASGFYHGVLHEGIRSFGTAVMRSKTELYNNYPNDLSSGEHVEFYFSVYNMLSDPSLNMWNLIPSQINANLPNSIEQGKNYLEINLPENLNGAHITASSDNENFSFTKLINGHALLPIDTENEGNVLVTISIKNFIPLQVEIPIVASDNIGIISHNLNSIIVGEESTLNLTAKNFSNATINNVTAEISSNSEFISGSTAFNFGSINSLATSDASATFNIAAECPDNEIIELIITFSNGDVSKLEIIAGGFTFDAQTISFDGDGFLDAGETSDMFIDIVNIGEISGENISVFITSLTDAVVVNNDEYAIASIPVGQTIQASFNVTAQESAALGRNLHFEIDVRDNEGRSYKMIRFTNLGEVDNTAPTGPDFYGYYAYDNNDLGYENSPAPVYDWIEIDPNDGGPATGVTVFESFDDASDVIDLPFTFRYYGVDYDIATICSNGWLSFTDTWMRNFRNWNIPAALGPKALLAPYWDDLKGANNGTIPLRVCTYYDQPNDRFIVEWNNAYNGCNQVSLEKFQIILEPKPNEDGDITFQYHTIDNPDEGRNYCTVGIENYSHTDGLCYTYAGFYPESATILQAGLAIKFTTNSPDSFIENDNSTNNYNFSLTQNYPNPFNPTTNIVFSLEESSDISLEIYNVIGQKITTLAMGRYASGSHHIEWNGIDENGKRVSSGIYFYKLSTPNNSVQKKMLLLK